MKTVYLTIQIIGLAILLIACGGESGDTTFQNNVSRVIVINCNNSNNAIATNNCGDASIYNYYSCLKNGDTLISDNNNTLLEIINKSDGTKKVCVKNTTPIGAAHILRN